MNIDTKEKIESIGINTDELIVQLQNIGDKAFSGNLNIKIDDTSGWVFSFRLGRLGWVSGGISPIDRWQRNVELAQLNLDRDKLPNISDVQRKIGDSHTLAKLFNRESIDRQQWADFITRTAIECLFDIIQFSRQSEDHLHYHLTATGANNHHLNIISPLIDIEPVLSQSIASWQEWLNAGLAPYLPSLFPNFSQPKQPAQLSTDPSIQQMILSIDGTRSLRSLAIEQQQQILTLTKVLLPFLTSGAIVLSSRSNPQLDRVETPPEATIPNQLMSSQQIDQIAAKSQLNIACINDNIFTYQCLEKIFAEYGHQSFGIQDPLKIVPTLIKNRPNLIFLDLVMSSTNGYEVCGQIRKISSLKDVPVVILTSRDGSRDRQRAETVGANGFLGKPVQSESVVKMLDKYRHSFR
jgi:two-component system, chemotaxis family, response regulator PixG